MKIIQWIMYLFIGIFIVWLTVFFNKINILPELMAFFSIVLYFIIYLGLGHFSSLCKKIKTYQSATEKENEEVLHMVGQIYTMLDVDKPFLDCTFNLSKMAKMLGISTHSLSFIINNNLKMNFSTLLNKYRIEEAKKRLTGQNFEKITIEGIAFDCGFNSISTFNTEFKKTTSLTPGEFRIKHKS